MKTPLHILFAALLMMSGVADAQVYNILHNFGSQDRDGTAPEGDLILNSNILYGTTVSSSTNYNGMFFKINTDGSGYKVLYSWTNGFVPEGGMVLISNTLYGTMFTGGAAANGSIFKINTDGSGFAQLHSFAPTVPSGFGTNYDGNRPQRGVITDGIWLYGTARYGGANGNGTVFKIGTDGSGFAVIKTFPATYLGTNNVSGNLVVTSGTNSDGAYPIGSLVFDGSTLYGTTYKGGTSNGVVFAMQTDGGGFNVLKYFPSINGIGTNSDGAAPVAGLTLSGDTLFGVAVGGGSGAAGNIFKLKTNGAAFTVLHDLSYNDGMWPPNTLFLDGGTLYGTTAAGGISNKGTIFMLLTNGGNFTVLRNFDNNTGSQCNSKFVVSSNILYGTANSGGANGGGVVFGIKILPQIFNDRNFGIQANAFSFNFTGISNQTAIVEFSTNLAQPSWLPLQTNLLKGAPEFFSDPQSGQYPNGFYRIRSP